MGGFTYSGLVTLSVVAAVVEGVSVVVVVVAAVVVVVVVVVVEVGLRFDFRVVFNAGVVEVTLTVELSIRSGMYGSVGSSEIFSITLTNSYRRAAFNR